MKSQNTIILITFVSELGKFNDLESKNKELENRFYLLNSVEIFLGDISQEVWESKTVGRWVLNKKPKFIFKGIKKHSECNFSPVSSRRIREKNAV